GLASIGDIAIDSAGAIYVSDVNRSMIDEFAPGTSGNVAPSAILSDADQPFGLAIAFDGSLYVGNSLSSNLWHFARGARTGDAPVDSIAGSLTEDPIPNRVAIDWEGRIYVPGIGRIQAYARGAMGNVAPVRRVGGQTNEIGGVGGIAFDNTGALYVADYGSS